jgi:uncharacterized membrane protein YbhN (UPF0104 family)
VGLTSVIGVVLGGAAMFYVVRRLAADWPDASDAVSGAEPTWLVLAVAGAALAMVSIGWGWRHVLALFGESVPFGRVVAWYLVGELGKYLPGGVWPVLGRGELARRGGVSRGRAYASVALSLVLVYLAALFVAAGFLPFALSDGGFSAWMLVLAALPLGVVLLHHRVLAWLVAVVEKVSGRRVSLVVPQWRDSLVLVARYVPTWLLVGTATWAVARALTPDASYPRIVFAAVLSWAAGFLAVPVPAGAGIREAVLTATSGLDGGVAAATAIVARILFVLVDVVGAAISAPAAGRTRRPVPPERPPGRR